MMQTRSPDDYDAFAECIDKPFLSEKGAQPDKNLPLKYQIAECTPIQYDDLLQDVILVPSPPTKQQARETYRTRLRKMRRMQNFDRNNVAALINHCPYEWVSKMGGRTLPLYRSHPRLHYAHPNIRIKHHFLPVITKEELLRHYDPNPCCEIYEWWLQSKKLQENDIFRSLTVNDLKEVHNLPPGQLEASMAWKHLAQRSAKQRKSQLANIKKNPVTGVNPKTCTVPHKQSAISFRKSLLNPNELSALLRQNKGH